MTDNDLYQQILGLTSPWRVLRVELLLDSEEVLVHVAHDASLGSLQCSECHRIGPGYDTTEQRRWRHLDTCQLKTYLVCSVPRIRCPEHGVRTAYIPWSEPNSRFTQAFEALAITVLRATTIQSKAAHLLRLSAMQVHDVMHRAVTRGLLRRDDTQIMKRICIDEKSIHKGHSYMTILSDADAGRVVDVAQGRNLVSARRLLSDAINDRQRPWVESVTMDMWPAFQSAQEHELPHADRVHDRFHIVKYLSDAVDQTRRAEHRRLSKTGDQSLNKSKYVWLKNPDKLTAKQKEMFSVLSVSQLDTAKVWSLKDAFNKFFACRTPQDGNTFFENWFNAAIGLGNRFLTKVAKMFQSHVGGLLNYLKHRTTNATAEGLNSRIQHIKASARGYRQFENFRVAILFHLGKLDMYPLKRP